jgi:tRNA (guanosine-2'-O-)-methyltransferase
MAHQSEILTYLQTFLTTHRIEKFKEILKNRTRHFTVAIEDVYQAHNASAILRSCDVFGIQDIHIIEKSYVFKNSNQVSKNANKWLNTYKYRDYKNNSLACVKALKSKGYQIVATTPHTNSCLLQDFDITKKAAFFFGVEKEGLSGDILNNADVTLKIPMYGFTESLNISVAAAIVLQHCSTKLHQSEIAWQLSEKEKQILELEWTKKTIKDVDNIIARYLATD